MGNLTVIPLGICRLVLNVFFHTKYDVLDVGRNEVLKRVAHHALDVIV